MTEPSNAVLEERIKQLTEEFTYFRKSTKAELKEMEEKVDSTRRIADEVNRSVSYVEKAVNKMDDVMTNFINVVNQQNQKIDAFVNSDKRLDNKRQFFVAILQVAGGIVIAILGMWGAGKL